MFQQIVIRKYVDLQSAKIKSAYELYKEYFLKPNIQETIRHTREEEFQDGFLRKLFVEVLGYTLKPDTDFNLVREEKNETDSKKADGAILINGEVRAVIELKDTKTTDLKFIEQQAFGYKYQHANATYVITSNFAKLRFYIDNAVKHIEWNLFELTEERFATLWLCLAYENISDDLPKKLKTETLSREDKITKEFYEHYKQFKDALFNDLIANNPNRNKLILFTCSQKILDRMVFILFSEDCGLLPPNTIQKIIHEWKTFEEADEYRPLCTHFKKYFSYLDSGGKGKNKNIFGYNGGLFATDEILNDLKISDSILFNHLKKLSDYDYRGEVNIDILGHIFENSLAEIEKLKYELSGIEGYKLRETNKRKKDGIFYTPRYITSYIVENTLGKLCNDKKIELGINNEEFVPMEPKGNGNGKKKNNSQSNPLLEKLETYRQWLLELTVCDPACGSGAFLNAALDFLKNEHLLIDKLISKLLGISMIFSEFEISILENNLFGVDINEESVEITKLALWLRTAKPNCKLNFLDANIKCGNSLISDPKIDPDKAFDWHKEFPHIFKKGGFDVVVGNPPYVDSETMTKFKPSERQKLANLYSTATGNWDLFVVFIERATQLVKHEGMVSMIVPNKLVASKYAVDVRQLLVSKNLLNVTDYSKVKVFEEANVYPCVFVLENDNACGFVEVNRMNSPENIYCTNIVDLRILKNESYWDKFFVSPQVQLLLQKISQFTKLQKYLPGICGGATVAEAYLLKEKIVEYAHQNQPHKRFVNTGTIDRYTNLWNCRKTQYIKNQYAAPIILDEDIKTINTTRYNQSASSKIIVAGMSLSPEAFYDNGDCIAGKSTTIIQGKEKKLKFILTILNSKLISFWFSNSFSSIAMSGGYVNIGVNELSMVPICDTQHKQPFIKFADQIQSLHEKIKSIRQSFLERLTDNFDNIKITRPLTLFDQLQFKQILSELKKQKIIIPLNKQSEWKEFFIDCQKQYNNTRNQITETDRKINQFVYELYGLTDEEIKIVEG
ncbi:MAG: Eco57I restriction-modification methylase domain-containing protein [Planctomycetaceae bacterium]|jgi:type I restriction-modification system DNA methylase subunit|nr:Eco57I restriction-modification methylase domain-containing protein [Planctomycetaceae bacterium]